ncbi:FRG domain protein [Shewanella sp. P1-14-1]|uniref:FRG domain-containing protein n=1 Tax=Shewanella sp. P1-14-1 TaxID=1723761 RepID=UPI0006D67BF7|nr:FRG domain-containing protein [Shewanella sp. P1-14-1]KPZ68225.1 FRG domain protein [Shewanella sp. P1-14-1]
MKGQWLGYLKGSNVALVTMNVDERENSYNGVAYFVDQSNTIPSLSIHFELLKKDIFQGVGECNSELIHPLDSRLLTPTSWELLKDKYIESQIPKSVNIKFKLTNQKLNVSAKTDIDTNVDGELEVSNLKSGSVLPSDLKSWNDFKQMIINSTDRSLYRGQNEPWKLQTSFHRQGRNDLTRYLREDIPELHRSLCNKTNHVFDLSNSEEFGALMNLAQHHGYPTPLLDWTLSPYVAAFFAFRGISSEDAKKSPDKKVRIYILSSEWRQKVAQNQNITSGQRHVSVIDLLGIENNRMIPQQATSSVTSVADIELHIKTVEQSLGIDFLHAVDLLWSERDKVVKELTLMGVTAGSLFPGLDGTCEELKERMFN